MKPPLSLATKVAAWLGLFVVLVAGWVALFRWVLIPAWKWIVNVDPR